MKEFYELLNLVQDKIIHGYKEEHILPDFKPAVGECRDCPLYLTRNRIVYGIGSENPRIMIIGTWPINIDEDNNLPISSNVLEYLKKWIKGIDSKVNGGLSFSGDCYVTNLLKCKTGWNKRSHFGNRDHREEIETCFNHLDMEITKLKPEVILALGETPGKYLCQNNHSLEGNRGHVHRYKNIPVIATYHPEMALDNYEALRLPVWDDLKLLTKVLNE